MLRCARHDMPQYATHGRKAWIYLGSREGRNLGFREILRGAGKYRGGEVKRPRPRVAGLTGRGGAE